MNKSIKVVMLIAALTTAPGALAESRASAESAVAIVLLPLAVTGLAVGLVSEPISAQAKASGKGNTVSIVEGEAGTEELQVTEKVVVGPSPKEAIKEGI